MIKLYINKKIAFTNNYNDEKSSIKNLTLALYTAKKDDKTLKNKIEECKITLDLEKSIIQALEKMTNDIIQGK